MVRTKNNFKPAKTHSSGFGVSLNDNSLIDGVVLMSAMSDKVTLDAQRKMDKLEQATPFDAETIPESIAE